MSTAEELGITDVLAVITQQYELTGNITGTGEFVCHCPNPRHMDRRPSCGINLRTGLFNCLSCHIRGDLVKLGQIVLEQPEQQVRQLIQPGAQPSVLALISYKLRTALTPLIHKEPSPLLPGPYAPGPLDYLLERGFTQQTLEAWGVRYCEREALRSFALTKSIAIPLLDVEARLTGWSYRKTNMSDDRQPKYLHTPGAPIGELWFGMHRYRSQQHITVCEGPLDAIWLAQAGIPALACMGGSPRPSKVQQLRRFKTVTLFFDRDAAGLALTLATGRVLQELVPVRVARYPASIDGKLDPASCPEALCRKAVERAIPWQAWMIKNRFPLSKNGMRASRRDTRSAFSS